MVFTTSRLAAIALVFCSVLSATSAVPVSLEQTAATPDAFSALNHGNVKCRNVCEGVKPVNSTRYFCRDARLGPKKLPKFFPLDDITQPYDRLGGLCAAEFLDKWTFPNNGSYHYPDNQGFLVNTANLPIKGITTLPVGTLLDRFGSEFGSYLSPAEAPYPQRAIPPSNLDTLKDDSHYPYSYHVYKVVKAFDVEAGPIAGWFGQPGAGTQYHTFKNILTLIGDGVLVRIDLKRS
ncbi:hypothetical protein BGZ96_004545 [Linnemannia gamsii]|uniref:TNT domain-containing protein n=1 Tax=Linnemannia gamsii TaxID=64522 RepID=A0ABQ7K695_9FUNG|nr:hypothetical protein BGZ96_004545 [Linnemannia gamsii]